MELRNGLRALIAFAEREALAIGNFAHLSSVSILFPAMCRKGSGHGSPVLSFRSVRCLPFPVLESSQLGHLQKIRSVDLDAGGAVELSVKQLSALKSRDSLRLRRQFLPLPKTSRDFLSPQDARFPLRRKSLANRDFICEENG